MEAVDMEMLMMIEELKDKGITSQEIIQHFENKFKGADQSGSGKIQSRMSGS